MASTDPSATEQFPPMGEHPGEPHSDSLAGKLNALRAAVLGANDGIVSTAGLVMGVAGATADRQTILIAGLAGLVAGALSMAVGEYVSVSTQRDTERALIVKETRELDEEPEEELAELAELYRQKGLSEGLARQVARRADRPRRAPVAPRHRARDRPGRADQPVAGSVGIDDLLHRRCTAAAADDHAVPR